ncbi:hypothetical protein EH165_10850 [Nakamurella antarctica]|uniref:Uncharacterized protein n=1 Tax=Nakamurella antarctica TaxID=1902245 RepID=A0A3G8ZMT0_9ACTN|nr:hypothetical protein [Nakamurella antarctica]AZI58553.1 hypothetical protein EH165_10850 [Nakamurella antarctica]
MHFDYFSAPSDDLAVSMVDYGPVAAPANPNGTAQWDTVSVSGVEPSIQLLELQELLTGVEFDEILDIPRAGDTLQTSVESEAMVVTITDALQAVLADSKDDSLAGVAAEWATSEEFGGAVEAAYLETFLHQLVGLARRARARGERLYCWVSFHAAT